MVSSKIVAFHFLLWCLIGISIFACVYGAFHIKEGCTPYHCIYNQTQSSDCIFSVPNTTYQCTYKYKLCPMGNPVCYLKFNNYCPSLNCSSSVFEAIRNSGIIISIILGCIYLFGLKHLVIINLLILNKIIYINDLYIINVKY